MIIKSLHYYILVINYVSIILCLCHKAQLRAVIALKATEKAWYREHHQNS